ncbi:MAG: PEGA domain-containing protein [Pseudomonadota bacterium]
MGDPDAQRIQAAAFEPLSETSSGAKRRLNPRRIALLVAGVVFSFALWFLLTARSLELQVIAEVPGTASISGLSLPFGERYLIRPGKYMVVAAAPGYHPFQKELEVTRDASQTVELVLQPLPGRISIASDPSAATVFIDGETVGSSPFEDLAVEAGEHVIRVEAPRFRTLEQALSVTGRDVQQNLSLTLEPAWGDISIASEPALATVLVDGEPFGETPLVAEILEGEHTISLRLPGFADEVFPLIVEAGVAQVLEQIQLTPATGVLSVTSSPSQANVSVNGVFAGQTPLELELEPNKSHRLSLSKAGYRRASRTIEMAAGSSKDEQISLPPLLGDVLVRVSPANAELFVNGRSVGVGTQTLSLPAVSQRIEARLEGYETIRQSVTPRAGLEGLVEMTLLTPEAARKARLKPQYATALGQTMVLMNPVDSPRNEFSMGASRRDPGRRANEVLHPVRLERPFYVQAKEVTNAAFRLFDSTHGSGQVEGNSLNREKQPVVQVSWQQAASFCNWLSQQEGLQRF